MEVAHYLPSLPHLSTLFTVKPDTSSVFTGRDVATVEAVCVAVLLDLETCILFAIVFKRPYRIFAEGVVGVVPAVCLEKIRVLI